MYRQILSQVFIDDDDDDYYYYDEEACDLKMLGWTKWIHNCKESFPVLVKAMPGVENTGADKWNALVTSHPEQGTLKERARSSNIIPWVLAKVDKE